MLIVLGVVLALLVAVWLIRLAIGAKRSGSRGGIAAVVAAIAVVVLATLAASGRLHWLAAAGAAVLPLLRRLVAMVRFLPMLRRLFSDLGYGRSTGAASGQSGSSGHAANARAPGAMTREDALALLGLPSDASREAIVEAHRRLIQRVHPDRGGSAVLAQQLNEARRVLLEEWVA